MKTILCAHCQTPAPSGENTDDAIEKAEQDGFRRVSEPFTKAEYLCDICYEFAYEFADPNNQKSKPPITSIETELLKKFPSLDPARIARAVELVYKKGMVFPARRDEHGNPITPSPNLIIVRSSTGSGYYYVRRKSCTCPDHIKGNVCKHRIAAYLLHTFLEEYQRILINQPEAITCTNAYITQSTTQSKP